MSDGPQDGEGSSIWDRLRRRKVVQWGIAYAAGAWGLLQGLQFLTDAFEWPSHVLRLATVVLVLGLSIALVLAWFHGDRGQRRISRAELAIVTTLFLIGGGLFWYYQHKDLSLESSRAAKAPGTPAPPTALPADRSIAVLLKMVEKRSFEERTWPSAYAEPMFEVARERLRLEKAEGR